MSRGSARPRARRTPCRPGPGRRSSRLNRLVLSTSTPTPTRYSAAERPSPGQHVQRQAERAQRLQQAGADVPPRGRPRMAAQPARRARVVPRRPPGGGPRAGRPRDPASRRRPRTRAPRRPPAPACRSRPARRGPPAGPTASAATTAIRIPAAAGQHEPAVVLAHDAGALEALEQRGSEQRPQAQRQQRAAASASATYRAGSRSGGGGSRRSAVGLRPNRPSAPSSAHTSAVLPSGRSRSSTLVTSWLAHERHLRGVGLHLLDAHDLRPRCRASRRAGRSRTRPGRTSRRPSARRGRARTRSRPGRCTRRARSRRAPAAAAGPAPRPGPGPRPIRRPSRSRSSLSRSTRRRFVSSSSPAMRPSGSGDCDHRHVLDVGARRDRSRPRSRRCSRRAACPSRRLPPSSRAAGRRPAPDRPRARRPARCASSRRRSALRDRAWFTSPRSDFSRSRLAPDTMPSSPSATPSSTPMPSARNTATSEIA